MLTLHAIQALFGDAMLLQFGDAENPKFILIDGGPKTVFREYLRDELLNIVGNQGELEAVIVSHIDTDHVKGVLDLLTDLKKNRDQGKEEFISIKELWHNSFSQTIDLDGSIVNKLDQVLTIAGTSGVQMDHASIVPESVGEGNKTRTFATDLGIPINVNTHNNFYSLDNTDGKVKYDNVEILVIGPTTENLVALRNDWDEWLENRIQEIDDGKLDLTSLSDDSVPNLSSITFLVKGDDKTILFTGDARGDHIIEGLKKRKLLKYGRLHVDVLKVPHHGSDRNSDRNFFDKITADIYVISADGKHNNPDYATMQWIIEESNKQERKILLYITNQTKGTDKILRDYPTGDWGYEMIFIAEGKNSVAIELA